MIWYQIRRAFAFGKIKHPDLAPFLTWVPLTVGLLLSLGFELLPVRPKFTGDGSVSRHMLNVFAILPGFYIAALAAVATFNREEMDFEMPNPAPKMVLRTRGVDQEMSLTFRMFLSHMFSYLTALSFVAVFLFMGAELIAPSAKLLIEMLPTAWKRIAIFVVSGGYLLLSFWLAAKIVLTTMIGLYFLAERIHRPQV
ncbi:hypothetical protein HGG72_23295 [Ochrobactrum pecoris]|uniref:Uncharacterized protein n=1 Tax=Brucella pecoris TaxID=867683 RepID=A0A5C5CJ83_9HYPH|nr:hypothetical protein [Brucella pecoris]MBB4091529.1 hypothetical protein [Brucella pecoris]NKW82558.1 hypothetical protein [Brucella pecoris]TNV11622.1 hypothetical protein FIB18_12450 [Brucella pecoris]